MQRFGERNSETLQKGIQEEIDRLARLVSDLRSVGSRVPTATFPDLDLSDAPILGNWAFATRAVPCLVGLSTGHPLLQGTRREIVTSEIHLISAELGWVRTRSRWYRLGRRADGLSKDS